MNHRPKKWGGRWWLFMEQMRRVPFERREILYDRFAGIAAEVARGTHIPQAIKMDCGCSKTRRKR